jgi:hypothetical protein
MAKFRCKQSGGIMEFHNEYDIEQIRMQSDYEEVEEVEEKKPTRRYNKKEEEQ